MKFNDVNVYRITHIENIVHIQQNGITHKNSPDRNENFQNIGDVSLIETRSKKLVRVDNGNCNYDKCETISLGDFVPFYFGVRMPMLYVAQLGGNFVEKATSPENIVYIACSLQKIISGGNTFYFTDGHATDMLTTFYNKDKIDELVNIVDWNAVKTNYWGGSENLNLKRKKQAEFLVKGDISPEHIIGFGCYNNKSMARLISMGISKEIIKQIPNAYY